MPKAQGPEEDRDEVLNPAVESGQSECRRRQMGGCCVVEDTDQNVDRDEKPSSGENDPYVSGGSLVSATLGGSVLNRHPAHPSLRTLELLRDLAVGKDSVVSRRRFGPILDNRDLTWHFQQDSWHVAIRRVDMPDGFVTDTARPGCRTLGTNRRPARLPLVTPPLRTRQRGPPMAPGGESYRGYVRAAGRCGTGRGTSQPGYRGAMPGRTLCHQVRPRGSAGVPPRHETGFE